MSAEGKDGIRKEPDISNKLVTPGGVTAEALFTKRNKDLVRMAARIVGPDHAEDITQIVWSSAGAQLEHVDDPDAYLRRAVTNRARTYWRDRGVAEKHGDIADVVAPADEPSAKPLYWGDTAHVDASRQGDARMALERVLIGIEEDLPPRQREVIKLRMQGHLEREIADILGITTGAVKAHINKARKKLEGRLEGYTIE